VLAAGLSRRFPPNKLLMPLGEKTVLGRVLEAVTDSRIASTVVVVGHDADRVRSLLKDYPCISVFNPDYQKGMGYSVARGVEYIGEKFRPLSASAVLLCLGDEPFLSSGLIDSVIAASDPREGKIVIPLYRGRRGHPAVFPFCLLKKSLDLIRKKGAREVIRLHPDKVKELEIDSEAVVSDIDTRQDYRRHLAGLTHNRSRQENERN